MAKLYPPYLDATVPSFYSYDKYDNITGQKKTITSLSVPFALNKTVGKADICGFAIKIKTLQSDTLVWSSTTMDQTKFDVDTEFQVTFELPETIKLLIGQFYKVQIAFVDETSTIGYYSTTAVVKYTTKPLITISGLAPYKANNHIYSYTGIYSQVGGDSTEKMYSCRFTLTDANGIVISDSGEMIHHSYNDESNRESHETFVIPDELTANQSYYLIFSVTTNNKMVVQSPRYRIIKAGTVMPDMNVTLSAVLNHEEGFVDLVLKNHEVDDDKGEKKVTGMFYIMRAASNDGYAWREMGKFTLQSQIPSRRLWKDYTIEQGVTYIYAIQQYNNFGLRSDRIEAAPILADFEDAFLFDGKRQLKIKFNPKISSFKRNTVEQKTDTIGGKYPFIFRNGNVSYHEFPISGLISYLADNNQQFLSLSDLEIESHTTQLTTENVAAERKFKMNVLQWLTNGEPKLFKSPSEGNFIVRLLNVSLTPTDSLGRMLHSFACTAYEIADCSYESLRDKGFVEMEEDVIQTRFQTVNIAGRSGELDNIADSIMSYFELKVNIPLTDELYWRIMNATYYKQTPEGPQAVNINIKDYVTELGVLVLSPGNSLIGVKALPSELAVAISALKGKISYASGKLNTKKAYSVDIRDALPGTIFYLDDEQITIGASGSYYVELPNGISNIVLPQDQPNLLNPVTGIQVNAIGNVTYSYHSDMANVFDLYSSSQIDDYPARMWFGTPVCERYNPYKGIYQKSNNLIECIQDVKTSIAQIYSIKFSPRHVQPLFFKEEIIKDKNEETGVTTTQKVMHYYLDMDCTNEIVLDDLIPAYVYQLCNPRSDYKYEDYYLYTQYFTDANFRKGYYVSEGQDHPYATTSMIDGNTKEKFVVGEDFYQIQMDGNTIILEDHEYHLEGQKIQPKEIYFGKGICCEMSYQAKVMTYSCEVNDHEVPKAYRDIYDARCAQWEQIKQELGTLSNDDIINHSTTYLNLLERNKMLPGLIEQDYNSLLTYVAVAKKDFEEEMKS